MLLGALAAARCHSGSTFDHGCRDSALARKGFSVWPTMKLYFVGLVVHRQNIAAMAGSVAFLSAGETFILGIGICREPLWSGLSPRVGRIGRCGSTNAITTLHSVAGARIR